MIPRLERITIYPIKSLDGVSLSSINISEGGALLFDRKYALFDQYNQVVNAKRFPSIHTLRTSFSADFKTVSLFHEGKVFSFEVGESKLNEWFSDFFGLRLVLRQNEVIGYPDDQLAWGATLACSASFKAISSWFYDMPLEELRMRFRVNLEISGEEPFWEDNLYDELPLTIPFQIGKVKFEGVKPCSRCVVPTRHPTTSEIFPMFQKKFAANRASQLPAWANVMAFSHYYKFSVNTKVSPTEAGKTLTLGDELIL